MPWKTLNEAPLDAPPIQSGLDTPAPLSGWFGKVVMLGDFAHRRVTQQFIDVCDPWLSHGMRSSRAQLGPRWLDTYLSAPVWRFAWAPGVVDEQWWFGVMMPSVDAVGRYFPLLICSADRQLPTGSDALEDLSDWYTHAGRTALATLQPNASLDSFEADLARAPPWQTAAASERAAIDSAPRRRHTLPRGSTVSDCARVLAGPAIESVYACHSLWLASPASSSDNADVGLTVIPGLPDPEQFALMLEGHW